MKDTFISILGFTKRNILKISAFICLTTTFAKDSKEFNDLFGEKAVMAAKITSDYFLVLSLFLAKQFNETGGTVAKTTEAKERIQ